MLFPFLISSLLEVVGIATESNPRPKLISWSNYSFYFVSDVIECVINKIVKVYLSQSSVDTQFSLSITKKNTVIQWEIYCNWFHLRPVEPIKFKHKFSSNCCHGIVYRHDITIPERVRIWKSLKVLDLRNLQK